METADFKLSRLVLNRNYDKRVTILVILFISSVFMALFGPKYVSMPYVYMCFTDFILSTFLYYSYKNKKNYLDFDTIFVLLYAILGFAYPVFLYDEADPFSIAFNLTFEVNFIPSGCIFFVLGIQAYYLGSIFVKKESSIIKNVESVKLKTVNNTLLTVLVIILCITFILSGGVQYYKSVYLKGTAESETGLLFQILSLLHSFVVAAVATEIYNKCIDSSYKLNKILIFSVSSVIVLMLYAGNRTLASQLALPVLGLYTMFFKEVGKLKILVFILVAILLMWVIQNNRSGIVIESGAKFEDVISDLTIPTRSTYSSMEYIEQYGYTHGMNMLGGIICVIPSFGRVLAPIFGWDPRSLYSAEFLTDFTLGPNTNLGLGTNIIADINLSFGLTGVIILMFFLGYFVNNQLYKAKNLNYYSIIIYACMMSYSAYLVRSTYTHPFKLIVWCLIIGVLNKSLSQKFFDRAE